MELPIFVKGLLIGLSIAAPVGPIGILCIRRTLSEGRLVGLATGMGAASADAIYGLIAGFGLTLITSMLVGQSQLIRCIGGLFLCYLGIQTLSSRPAEREAQVTGEKLLGAYSSSLFLTLTNPMTILSFIGIFAGLGIASQTDLASCLVLVLGVFLGSRLVGRVEERAARRAVLLLLMGMAVAIGARSLLGAAGP